MERHKRDVEIREGTGSVKLQDKVEISKLKHYGHKMRMEADRVPKLVFSNMDGLETGVWMFRRRVWRKGEEKYCIMEWCRDTQTWISLINKQKTENRRCTLTKYKFPPVIALSLLTCSLA